MSEPSDRPSLGDYRHYLTRRHFARATIAERMLVARRWLDHIADRWTYADHRDVEAWIDEQPVSAAVQRNYVSMLRSFYRWAMRDGLATVDPTALVDQPRMPHYLPRPAPEHEIANVLAAAPADVAAMVALMAGAGLRCCEVARLRWSDLRLDTSSIHVTGKGSRDRVIVLPPQVVYLLTILDTTTGHVFVNADGQRYSANRISRLVRLQFIRHGYSTTAHQLRHRAATVALKVSGGDLLAVRDFLGHSSVATTQGYTKVIGGAAAATSSKIRLPEALAT